MLESDPSGEIVGGIIGSGSLLLAWAIVQLGLAITGLTKKMESGINVTLTHERGVRLEKER